PARMMPSPAESHPVKSPTTSQDCPRGSRGAGRQRHGGPARADRDQPAWATRRHRTRATQNPGNTKAPSRLPRNGAFLLVEVPGIEPGSSVASPGLLRAQFTVPLLGPTGHVNKPV